MGADRQHEGRGDVAMVGRLLFGADKQVAKWVAERIPGYQVLPDVKAIGVVQDFDLIAGVTFEQYNGVNVMASIAATPGSRWADRRTLFGLFYYPFVSLDCHAITLTVSANNLPSLNLATKLGFTGEAIVSFAAHDGSDLVVLKMFRDQCRWIGYGQGRRSA
ncbi:GNAT family N-acetyltransferase [Pseudooceanicola atlanticus]|uniref:GNAT family N-acetyltransferase n=1 Tax=Pseudooceanicola atlanticus TaxID=1461694 RepID=UPI0023520306|nr:GNAT family protein [Pseudooceanicola atlanticus]